MTRRCALGGLYKLRLEDILELICDYLIPAAYLRVAKHGNKELRKVNFYGRQARTAILNSDLDREEKFQLLEDLKSYMNFIREENQIGRYCLNNGPKNRG